MAHDRLAVSDLSTGTSASHRPRGRPVLRIEGLIKRLGRGIMAIDGLDLTVEEGQVLGLAGPNGSGKSVTLKVLLGLVRPTSGRVLLFEEPVRPGARVLRRVGALVDGPGFVPHLSGLDNLRLAWRLTQRSEDEAELDDALALAGLGDAIRRPYGTYLHGMRYRLGLAQALLGRPDLLLLDEPTTGLDPVHIRDVRQAIVEVAGRGTTVVLSSHLLSEVEQVCTHAAVIQSGRLVASGRIAELVGPVRSVYLEVDDRVQASESLSLMSGVKRVVEEAVGLRVEGDVLRPVGLFSALHASGVEVRCFREGRTLEEAYLDLFTSSGPASRAGHDGVGSTTADEVVRR
jgi:ABC-2 type transport system ATP-binding protein